MSLRDLEECGDPEGDGCCVVNFHGGREYWCRYADQDTIREGKKYATVYCRKLGRRVRAAMLR